MVLLGTYVRIDGQTDSRKDEQETRALACLHPTHTRARAQSLRFPPTVRLPRRRSSLLLFYYERAPEPKSFLFSFSSGRPRPFLLVICLPRNKTRLDDCYSFSSLLPSFLLYPHKQQARTREARTAFPSSVLESRILRRSRSGGTAKKKRGNKHEQTKKDIVLSLVRCRLLHLHKKKSHTHPTRYTHMHVPPPPPSASA